MVAKMRFKKYSIWFLVNFIYCLLPLFLSWLIVRDLDNKIFSSFLAFSYTMLISSLYLFDKYRKPDSVLEWLAKLVAFGLLAFFVIYPTPINSYFSEGISKSIPYVGSIILIIVLVTSLLLNIPAIEDEIRRLREEQPYKKAKETTERANEMYDKLRREGK